MAMDKLTLYNNALVLLGQRYLNNLTDNEESQLYLDSVYNFKAVEHCLELSKPVFATKTVKLSTSTTSGNHDLDNVFDLPSDYITPVGVFSDSKLDQPISRYIIESRTIACEYDDIYLRYISNDSAADQTNWTPSFYKLVASYLAKEIAPKIDPNKLETALGLFDARLEDVKREEEGRKPAARSVAVATTLTETWLNIYNDALLCMGLDGITTNEDDSNRRSKIDRALNAGVVSELLEDHPWNFGTTSYKSYYDPSLESGWGYGRVHAKPNAMHRLKGVFVDERFATPLRDYHDETGKFYCDYDVIYIEFISDSFLSTPELWPTFFKRLVAAKLANDAAGSLVKEGASVDLATRAFMERKSSALSNDAASSPPIKIRTGSWARSRGHSNYGRGRP